MRCFIAIELPPEVREQLLALQERLSSLGRAVRWTRPEQIHLTLKFLGEVPDAQAAAVCEIARQVSAKYEPFDLEIGGVGFFPPGGPARILWTGVIEPPAALLEFQRAMEAAFADIGFPPEQRAYRPHLTIGRAHEGIPAGKMRAAIQGEEKFSAGKFRAQETIVFQSILGQKSGTLHVPIARAPFAQG